MSDKPPVQADLAEKLASIIASLPTELAFKYIETFWKIMTMEWAGVDRLRYFYTPFPFVFYMFYFLNSSLSVWTSHF